MCDDFKNLGEGGRGSGSMQSGEGWGWGVDGIRVLIAKAKRDDTEIGHFRT